MKQFGQFAKNRRPVLRIIVADNFTGGFVVSDDTCRWWLDFETNRFAIDLDMISKLNPLTDVRRFIIDRNAPFKDELFHLKARTHAGLGQHLVQFGRFRLWRQHPLWQCYLRQALIGIKQP
ncbi:hypothetical protein GALL_533390 [mine drainage metagenome]|uniref:Uncharacterized protein n=1 Tax=mine drainage metagenome TaxID=410659 RepID=A0A1J5P0N7_9ZZZZ